MKTFKVGDRVKDKDGDKGTILCIYDDIAWTLMDDKDCAFLYEQEINCLRKLKPKVKREPRRVWVHPDRMTDNVSVSMVPTFGWTEFIEAKK